jgi:hypothetical protein
MKKADRIAIHQATGRGRSCFALALLTILAVGPTAVLAQNITIDNSPKVGLLPHMITAFVVGGDVLPAGGTDYYVFTLFDTGSTRVTFDANTAASLGVANGLTTDIRINGMAAIDPVTLYAPIYAGQAQAEVLAIPISLPASPPNRTLIGGPITNVVKAVIDYTTTVTRGPFAYLGDVSVEGPDITFYPAGSPAGFTPAITLSLEAFGNNPSNDPGLGQRFLMYNVSFNEGSVSISTPASGELNLAGTRFLYDTGTTVTMITAAKATELGLTGPADFTQPMSDGTELDGYYVDSITMTGAGGVYTVLNAPVVVAASLGGSDARIGSNIFSQVKLLFDGPAATLGIGEASNSEPVANAGPDQLIEATGPTTPFTLDGTGSSDPDEDTLSYVWSEGGNSIGEDAIVELSRGCGTFIFTLTVTDPGGLTSTDDVTITIQDTTPPDLTPPADIEVEESDPLGTAVYLGEPSVYDICDTSVVPIHDAPALFPLGDTTVTWTATDDSGNTATATQTVTVVPGTPVNQLSNLMKLIGYSVASGDIAPEMQPSLMAKINAAIDALVKGNASASKVAMNDLKALVNQVEAQTDNKITPTIAAEIVTRANRIIAALGS